VLDIDVDVTGFETGGGRTADGVRLAEHPIAAAIRTAATAKRLSIAKVLHPEPGCRRRVALSTPFS